MKKICLYTLPLLLALGCSQSTTQQDDETTETATATPSPTPVPTPPPLPLPPPRRIGNMIVEMEANGTGDIYSDAVGATVLMQIINDKNETVFEGELILSKDELEQHPQLRKMMEPYMIGQRRRITFDNPVDFLTVGGEAHTTAVITFLEGPQIP